ncbi:conjugal transfer protein TrbF [Telmatospirillum siberiense]|uniref:Conjugal transfer protein TrbF n=1 Tax=Telmatospirillum siberiense TaxID=382514 RepID=A0A2N3PRB8_9PROT|nr:conjugal transfer protein TrbF [Telmatospirillum siberiense]PKU22957.1 conjugal transfer protein TrbF [Telmatospirillum siberiense]
MFKRSSARYGRTPEPETPYQKAAQVWDERIGSARVQAKNWRLMAFGSLILSAGLAGGLIWQSARGTVVPWVVQVDKLGEAQAVAPAQADYQPSDPQIAWYLARFIEDVRSISADPIIVRQNWLRAYDFTNTAGAAALNDYARADDPFAKVGRQQIAVDVSSVIRASPTSFRVAWVQRRYQDGALAETARWSAILSVLVQVPHDADRLRKNPLGVYVSAINWSKELGQ